jgi:lipopolysaccharide/colanic/teichoic acid biosynthesis glycosyltransferase
VKRTFDLVASAAGLLILSPVLAIVALLVKFRLGGPVLFRQNRPGLGGREFTLAKFRTMTSASDGQGPSDEERMTDFGRTLRSTSVDELPELWNVLKGEMSIVGPRPLLTEYLPLYSERQSRRHEVRPGMTGWAQVNGRNDLPWPDRLEMDVWYVDNHSFWLDMKIIGKTFGKVLSREGVSQGDNATVEYFAGNES